MLHALRLHRLPDKSERARNIPFAVRWILEVDGEDTLNRVSDGAKSDPGGLVAYKTLKLRASVNSESLWLADLCGLR